MFRQLLFCTISAILLCAQLAAGRTVNVPAEFTSIQSAINAASPGDTVLVAEGTYFENISFRGKRLVVASNYIHDLDPASIRATIIDGSMPVTADSGSVVRMTRGEPAGTKLCGFTLRNGIGTLVPGSFAGGGILVAAASSPTLCHNIIHDCSALMGAGIAVRNSNVAISNTVIYSNEATQGGGLSSENAVVVFNHNIVHQNSADSRGGGIYETNSFIDIINSSISGNSSFEAGGFWCDGGVWTVENCNFYENTPEDFNGCGEPSLGDFTKAKNYNLDSSDIYHNIHKPPLYSNPAQLDFRVQCSSHLIDAGQELPETYPIGGAREDIGAWEYNYRIGDINEDGKINLIDATLMVNMIFAGLPLPCPIYVTDCDCNRRFFIGDIVALINFWGGYGQTPCLFNPQQAP